jgi:AcrR family transcriptional regulator
MTTATDESLSVDERLIRGAIALIDEEGSSSLGVRRLAQAADRSSMCVYSHFGSRAGLLSAVYDRVSGQLLAAVTDQKDPGSAYREWARQNPRLYALLFDQPLDALDLDAGVRRGMLAGLMDSLSHQDSPDRVEEWARLHGEISYERILS